MAGIFRMMIADHSLSRFEWGYLSGKLILLALGVVLFLAARKKRTG